MIAVARVCAALCCLALAPIGARAQQLAVRHYTVEDGLSNDTVGHAFQDRHGYLWFATAEGVSRFDGYEFVTYSTGHGLGGSVAHHTTEAPDGTLWIATSGGLSRLNETPGPVTFTNLAVGPQQSVSAFGIAPDGRIWCIQDDGIYVGSGPAPAMTRGLDRAAPARRPLTFHDRTGQLWFSHNDTLFEVRGERLVEHRDGATREPITGIAQHPDGALLVTRAHSLVRFDAGSGEWRALATGLPDITALFTDSRGDVWLGATLGLWRVDLAVGRARPVRGVSGFIADIHEDRDGNLWVSSHDRGVFKIPAERILSYTAEDGFADGNIASLVEGDGGRLYAITQRGGAFEIRPDGVVPVAGSTVHPFSTIRRRIVQDADRRWWMWTDAGAYRIDGALDFRKAARVSDVGDPFPANHDGPSLFVDPQYGLLVATADRRLLAVSEGAVRPLATWGSSIGVGGRIARTRDGAVWLGGHAHLWRWPGQGGVERIPANDGVPDTAARALFADSRGWLWVGTPDRGVSVTEDPGAARPTFRNYSTANGLSSAWVSSMTEDLHGRMYFVTGKGLDRFDPKTGHVRRITRADGLVESKATYVLRDSRGDIWVGTTNGVSRLVPEANGAHPAPAVAISRIRIGDRDVPLTPRGSRAPLTFELNGSRDSVQINYVALNFTGENALRYRFRLDGAADGWTGPTESRSVIYANLAPGRYVFRVHAIDADGNAGPETATLAFTVPVPIWLRWWFLLGVGLVLSATAILLHRMRVRQLLAMERVRRQVSHDLHDDLGAGLVQIAAMGELAGVDPAASARLWRDVAALARSLRDKMSDIVWAVDPSRDRFADVVQRMKDAAYGMLEADGVIVEFRAPQGAAIDRMVMTTDYRRHLLLILKEAVANIVRHAQATRVTIDIEKHGKELRVAITDDGIGFAAGGNGGGNGLRSMRRRVEDLGGRMTIDSAPGKGTAIRIELPV